MDYILYKEKLATGFPMSWCLLLEASPQRPVQMSRSLMPGLKDGAQFQILSFLHMPIMELLLWMENCLSLVALVRMMKAQNIFRLPIAWTSLLRHGQRNLRCKIAGVMFQLQSSKESCTALVATMDTCASTLLNVLIPTQIIGQRSSP